MEEEEEEEEEEVEEEGTYMEGKNWKYIEILVGSHGGEKIASGLRIVTHSVKRVEIKEAITTFLSMDQRSTNSQ
ncbi:hypothetical protein PAMP_014211 [Pampus punctatissimus]